MSKITGYAALSAPAVDDVLAVVDVDDTTMAASGTTKKITVSGLTFKPWQFTPEAYGAVGDGATGGGGTGTSGTATFTDTGLGAPAAPTVSNSGSGGTIAAGTYQVKVTLVNQYGETTASTAGSTTTSGTTSTITITAPAGIGDATAWYAYVTQPGGSTYTRQQAAGSPTALGTNLVLTAPPTSSGANPPGADTSHPTFTSGDVGKLIIINQGTGGHVRTNPFTGTISAVNSATSVTLSANLAANAASAPYIYGTDDAPAFAAAMDAMAAYAAGSSSRSVAELVCGAKNYMLGAVRQTTSPARYNCHIPVPAGPQFGQKLLIKLTGAGGANAPRYWESSAPNVHGTCLVSASFPAAQPDATYGQQSVIGGPTSTTGLSPGLFANTMLVIDGITIIAPYNSEQYGVDGTRLACMNVPDGAYQAYAPVNLSNYTVGGPWLDITTIPNNGVSCGFAFPISQNNAACDVGHLCVEGAYIGVQFEEHFTAQRLTTLVCHQGAQISTGGSAHGATILQHCCEVCDYSVYNASTAGPISLVIGLLDQENISTAHVYDPSNFLYGMIGWYNSSASHPVTTGAANLTVWNYMNAGPGVWSGAPSVPASGTAAQNTSYRDATVYISGTQTGNTQVDGTTLGVQASVVRVPSGHTITLTYSVAPAWVWVLD